MCDLDVVATFFEHYGRQMNVKTMLCANWAQYLFFFDFYNSFVNTRCYFDDDLTFIERYKRQIETSKQSCVRYWDTTFYWGNIYFSEC